MKIVRVVVIEGVDLAKKDIFGLRYVVAKEFRQIRGCCFFFFTAKCNDGQYVNVLNVERIERYVIE